jgi:uncharacterized protein with gpF-like domain
VQRRQWVSTRDDRTRESHIDLDGAPAEIGQPFEIDGESAMYPGDFGVPELDINCRCTTIPIVGDDEPKSGDALDVAWKKFDQSTRPWERETQKALVRAWNRQQEDALRALRAA